MEEANPVPHWKIMISMLEKIRKEKKISFHDLELKIGKKKQNIWRVMQLKYQPSLGLFLDIATALEVRFFFEDKEDKTDLYEMFNKAIDQLRNDNRSLN